MKPNPERNWSIQFWGDKDEEHYAASFRGTVDGVLARADEEESEFEWQAMRISITALGA